MIKIQAVRTTLILLVAALLQTCGTAHVQQEMVADDIHGYASAFVASVEIESREQNGDSLRMNEKMKNYAEEQIRLLINNSSYQYLSAPATIQQSTLAFNLEIEIVYGSRAARYWAGFGAGKGSVRSTLRVVDSMTGELKYSATGASDLSVGGFGGSMEAVITGNIDELLQGYPQRI